VFYSFKKLYIAFHNFLHWFTFLKRGNMRSVLCFVALSLLIISSVSFAQTLPDKGTLLSAGVYDENGEIIHCSVMPYRIHPNTDDKSAEPKWLEAYAEDDTTKSSDVTFANVTEGVYLLRIYFFDKTFKNGYYNEDSGIVENWHDATRIIVTKGEPVRKNIVLKHPD
jgi:hypothetical protein